MTASENRMRPVRGEIWLAALGAARPAEVGKTRPVIIMSDETTLGIDTGLAIVVPISSSRPTSPLRPQVAMRAGLERDSVVVCFAVTAIARTRLLRRLGVLDDATLSRVTAITVAAIGGPKSIEALP